MKITAMLQKRIGQAPPEDALGQNPVGKLTGDELEGYERVLVYGKKRKWFAMLPIDVLMANLDPGCRDAPSRGNRHYVFAAVSAAIGFILTPVIAYLTFSVALTEALLAGVAGGLFFALVGLIIGKEKEGFPYWVVRPGLERDEEQMRKMEPVLHTKLGLDQWTAAAVETIKSNSNGKEAKAKPPLVNVYRASVLHWIEKMQDEKDDLRSGTPGWQKLQAAGMVALAGIMGVLLFLFMMASAEPPPPPDPQATPAAPVAEASIT